MQNPNKAHHNQILPQLQQNFSMFILKQWTELELSTNSGRLFHTLTTLWQLEAELSNVNPRETLHKQLKVASGKGISRNISAVTFWQGINSYQKGISRPEAYP